MLIRRTAAIAAEPQVHQRAARRRPPSPDAEAENLRIAPQGSAPLLAAARLGITLSISAPRSPAGL